MSPHSQVALPPQQRRRKASQTVGLQAVPSLSETAPPPPAEKRQSKSRSRPPVKLTGSLSSLDQSCAGPRADQPARPRPNRQRCLPRMLTRVPGLAERRLRSPAMRLQLDAAPLGLAVQKPGRPKSRPKSRPRLLSRPRSWRKRLRPRPRSHLASRPNLRLRRWPRRLLRHLLKPRQRKRLSSASSARPWRSRRNSQTSACRSSSGRQSSAATTPSRLPCCRN
mmetsp:Transcript_33609/g.73550  ORF Transcript_33609/g.73550 Transcript_33609/m.73550 type:complete len:223 (-) Transcript_33609:13-681(-)